MQNLQPAGIGRLRRGIAIATGRASGAMHIADNEMQFRYLLFVRFLLINLVSTGFVVAVFLQGWLDAMFKDEIIRLVSVIAAVFVYGLILCAVQVWRTSAELNDVKSGAPAPDSRAGKFLATIYGAGIESRTLAANALRTKLLTRIAIVRHFANSLVFLGLIGTVIGFIIALSAVDAKASADADTIAPVITRLISGMSIALYTTLVGAVLHIWLIVNHRLLSSGTSNLYTSLIELGESRGRT